MMLRFTRIDTSGNITEDVLDPDWFPPEVVAPSPALKDQWDRWQAKIKTGLVEPTTGFVVAFRKTYHVDETDGD